MYNRKIGNKKSKMAPHNYTLSPIGHIQILTYLTRGILGAAIFDCIIRSRHGVIKKVIVINCNLITFSKIIGCNCN